MKNANALLALMMFAGGVEAQIPSYCPDIASFSISTSGNTLSINPPVQQGWNVYFPPVPAPVVSGMSITLGVYSTATTSPTVANPPAVFTGLAAGSYTVNIERYFSPPGLSPPRLQCVPLVTSGTFEVLGAPVATPVPSYSVVSVLALVSLILLSVFVRTPLLSMRRNSLERTR